MILGLLLLAPALLAQDDEFTDEFNREGCTFTSTGNNPYFPLTPGYVLDYEGQEEDDEGELVDIALTITITADTELVDGVMTRVLEEVESEDGELVEVSRNFIAMCRETGDLWYFGEDVDDYEDGEIVGHEGAWRAGQNGAAPGIFLLGTQILGARYFQEVAPGIALDLAEVISLDEQLIVPAGTFEDLLFIEEGSGLEPDAESSKWYAHGIGLVKDDDLDLIGITPPPCQPGATTHCLADGRFKVEVAWQRANGNEGLGNALLGNNSSGEFWFFGSDNTELLVKVLDACDGTFNSFWVFAAGLTNVGVTLTVTDTQSGQIREYENLIGADYQPVLDTQAFQTCP